MLIINPKESMYTKVFGVGAIAALLLLVGGGCISADEVVVEEAGEQAAAVVEEDHAEEVMVEYRGEAMDVDGAMEELYGGGVLEEVEDMVVEDGADIAMEEEVSLDIDAIIAAGDEAGCDVLGESYLIEACVNEIKNQPK